MRRSNMLKYQKFAAENMQGFECIFFFIKDDFIREVLQINDAVKPLPVRATSIIKLPMNEALMGYVQSIKPYFNESFIFQEALLRLKMQELLFGLIAIHHDLVPHLIDFSLPYKNDLRKVMEEHFTKNLSLEEFAYITGKSLSAFKREFQQVFNISPGKWLLKRRLDHSRKLLMHTEMNVSDACYESGFENLSHFSRSFKSQFGINPLQIKQLS
nr:AraC family transcriptional regulator [Chitinophaga flava]